MNTPADERFVVHHQNVSRSASAQFDHAHPGANSVPVASGLKSNTGCKKVETWMSRINTNPDAQPIRPLPLTSAVFLFLWSRRTARKTYWVAVPGDSVCRSI